MFCILARKLERAQLITIHNMKKQGFSLIEILVVTGIMGILLAVGIASYNKMNNRSRVEQAAQLLATQLQTLQKRADAGVSCENGAVFNGVQVAYASMGIDYCDWCDGGCDSDSSKSFDFINGVNVESFNTFMFKGLGKGVDIPQNIDVSRADIIYNITITPAGGISVSKI